MEADNDSDSQLVMSGVNASADMAFSPDDKFLLCCPGVDIVDGDDQHRMRVRHRGT